MNEPAVLYDTRSPQIKSFMRSGTNHCPKSFRNSEGRSGASHFTHRITHKLMIVPVTSLAYITTPRLRHLALWFDETRAAKDLSSSGMRHEIGQWKPRSNNIPWPIQSVINSYVSWLCRARETKVRLGWHLKVAHEIPEESRDDAQVLCPKLCNDLDVGEY